MPQTQPKTEAEKVAAVREHIAHSSGGSTQMYRHSLSRVIYTSGVQFVAETLGAHWLVDAIISHQHTARVRRETFQIWTFRTKRVPADGWMLECWTDTPGSEHAQRVAVQAIEYSDFPRPLVEASPFKLYLENGVLLLPEER